MLACCFFCAPIEDSYSSKSCPDVRHQSSLWMGWGGVNGVNARVSGHELRGLMPEAETNP